MIDMRMKTSNKKFVNLFEMINIEENKIILFIDH